MTNVLSLRGREHAHDALADILGLSSELKTLRSGIAADVVIPLFHITDLEVDGPDAATANLSRRAPRRPEAPVASLDLSDDDLLALFEFQEIAYLTGTEIRMSLSRNFPTDLHM